MTIISNRIPRALMAVAELTPAERYIFDYIDPEERHAPRIFRYRGALYDVLEFVRIVSRSRAVGFECGVAEDSPLLAWHGIAGETYYSGVVVRYTSDFEHVVVGRYFE